MILLAALAHDAGAPIANSRLDPATDDAVTAGDGATEAAPFGKADPGAARDALGNAPLTVRAAKVAIREALKDESARDLTLCKRLVDECFASADYTEGRTAFMQKRKPVFTGR